MVRAVSTCEYEQVVDTARDGFAVPKSSDSREFAQASAAEVRALAERRFDGQIFSGVAQLIAGEIVLHYNSGRGTLF
jgi:hypothetical protein